MYGEREILPDEVIELAKDEEEKKHEDKTKMVEEEKTREDKTKVVK